MARAVSEPPRHDVPLLAARAVSAALVLLALLRALTLGGEYYDAYETRLAARTLLGWETGQPFPVYRSPLLILASVACEALGRAAAWVGPALLAAAAYGGLVAAVEVLARRLGARPWVAAAAGTLCALDLAAWDHAAHGLPDVPAATACALALMVVARPGPWAARPVTLGLLVGLAALARHNAGLVGLALLAGVPRADDGWRPALGRVALAGVVSAGLYLAVSTLVFAWGRGSLGEGLAGHSALAEFQRLQLAENRVRYGAQQPPLAALLYAALSMPWFALLAPLGAAHAARRGASPAARACLVWAATHLLVLSAFAGHVEGRYLLPALPALAALSALALDRLAGERPAALVVAGLVALPLVVRGPYALAHARDPVTRASVPARLAAEVEVARGPRGRVFWTTTHPYPVAPRVVFEQGTPLPRDPVHAIFHVGPVVLAYHLERPVVLLGPVPGREGGLREADDLRDLVRRARLGDGTPFRPGDVLVAGTPFPSRTWEVKGRAWPPLLIAPVVAGEGGVLDVAPRPFDVD